MERPKGRNAKKREDLLTPLYSYPQYGLSVVDTKPAREVLALLAPHAH